MIFQSILTHEIGHAAGFLSLATQTGTFQVQSGNASAAYSTMLYTRYDSLLTNQEGQSIVNKAGNGNTAFTLGETLSLGDTGLTAYNPATWQQGSSMPTSTARAIRTPSCSIPFRRIPTTVP